MPKQFEYKKSPDSLHAWILISMDDRNRKAHYPIDFEQIGQKR